MDAVDGEDAEDGRVQRQDDRFERVHWIALILLGAAVGLAPPLTARTGFVGFAVLYAFAAAAWLPLRHRSLRLPYAAAIAVLLRASLLVHEPLLSPDVYRYLSDGRVVAAGGNPYDYRPSDPRVEHREIRSIYPPHAQLLFAAAHELTPWRLLIVAADLVAIVLLRRRGLAYATCPVVLFEGTWSGHVDAIAALLLLIALLRNSAVAAAFATGLKIIPAAALPSLFRRAGRSPRYAAVFATVLFLPALPFLGGPFMPGLEAYATRWIFNSPAYSFLSAALERIPRKEIWTHHPLRFEAISDLVYRHLHAEFLARVILAAAALVLIASAKRVSTAVAALLLCSPTIHPWYWLTLVPAALTERSAWIFFALCAPFSYLLYEGARPLLVFALCYGVPAVLAAARRPPSATLRRA